MKLFSFYILVRLLTDTNSVVQFRPWNMAVLAGQRMTMECNPGLETLDIYWYFIAFGGSDEIRLNSKSQTSNSTKGFSLNGKIPGESLTINSSELKHAGKYICTTLTRQAHSSKADTARFVAQVIVLESDPSCHFKASIVKENDNIEMWCTVTYSGNWAPVMKWKEANGHLITKGILTEATTISLTLMLNLSADAGKHNSSYSCQIYFSALQNQAIDDLADNIPDYHYEWTSPLIRVLYGPKDAFLTPRKEFYSKGDRIRCSAEAHPSPRYEWKILEYNETFEGPLFVIRSEMIRPASTSLQCTAISDTTGLQAKSHIVKIGLPALKSVSITIIIVIPVIATTAVILIVTIIGLDVRSRKRAVEETERETFKGSSELKAAITDEHKNISCKPGVQESNLSSTKSLVPEATGVQSEYTPLGNRELPKPRAYTALVLPQE